MNEAPTHEPYDFMNMPLSNEQKILACLERIEVLLTPKVVIKEASREEQIAALASKTMGTRRK